MKIFTLAIGLCLAVALGIGSVACAKNDGQLVFINEGPYKILRGEIEVCGQKLTIENLEPGQRKVWNFKITVDSHYHVSLDLGSDQTVVKDLGYVTNGFSFNDTIVVRNADVFLSEHKVSGQSLENLISV